MSIKWYCPVCGYDLTEQINPHRVDEKMTVYDTGFVFYTEICPSCGIEFGMGDLGNKKTYENDKKYYIKLRKQWIANGMKWWGEEDGKLDERKLQNWNPQEQLKNIPPEFM